VFESFTTLTGTPQTARRPSTLPLAIKMNKRSILVSVSVFMILVGVGFAAVPFFSSMNPTMKVKEDAKIRVSISSIPEDGAIEIDWHSDKVFLVRNPKPMAFRMPYWDEAYRLPDPTWARAIVPCEVFKIGGEGFSCIDPKMPEGWRNNAKWDIYGGSKSSWMPDLQVAPYEIQGDKLVISPEYK